MDMSDVYRRLDNIEREKKSLDWLVVYLAKKSLMKDGDPLSSANKMRDEIIATWSSVSQHVLHQDPDSAQTVDILLMSADIQVLADNIYEEVKATLEHGI